MQMYEIFINKINVSKEKLDFLTNEVQKYSKSIVGKQSNTAIHMYK